MGLSPSKSFGLGFHNSSSHNCFPVKGTEVTVLIRSFLSEENMNTKFGAKQPTGTPSLAWSCVVVIVSLLAGASVVHNIYKPDLEFDTSLERKMVATRTNMHSGVYNHRLASRFYKDFSIWLYHGVVGTPGPAPWTPARTPAKTLLPGARSFASSEYYSTPRQTPSRPKTPVVFSTSSDSYAPSEEELEMEEEQVLDEPYQSPKFANPWLQEVAVLSWGTALNVIRTPEIVLTVMALILCSLFKHLSHHDFKAVNWLLSFCILALCLVFFSFNDDVPTFVQGSFIFIRETSHNAYRASSYVISSLSVYMPFKASLTFGAITKRLLKLHISLFNFWMIFHALLISTNAYLMLVSALLPSYITGYAVAIATAALCFHTCRFFSTQGHRRISATRYPLKALLTNEVKGAKCDNGGPEDLAPEPLGEVKRSELRNTTAALARPDCILIGGDIVFWMDIKPENFWDDILIVLALWGINKLYLYLVPIFYSKNIRK
ncbi:ABC transporter domain-containing protein [Citrus sinensis]|nr:ABC transporter domain-containing protein [Citrus sinensis]